MYGSVGWVTIFGGSVGREILVNGGGTVVGEPEDGKYFDEMLRFVVVAPPYATWENKNTSDML